MNWSFSEALKAMEEGKAVKRDAWVLIDGYRLILPGSKNVFACVNAHVAPNIQWAPLPVEDLKGTDWRVVTAHDLVEKSVETSEEKYIAA